MRFTPLRRAKITKSHFPTPMHRLLILFALLLGLVPASGAPDWTVVKVDGRDYLTMDNIAEFYSLSAVRRKDKEASATSGVRSIRASVGSPDFFINNLKFILSYPAIEHDGKVCISRMDLVKLIEPVMRPSKIKNAEPIDTIVLDAGHGGHDNGAMSIYGPEKAFALDVVLRAKALLQATGLKVVLTRSDDTFITLEDRTRIANQYKRAIFIAVHFNAGGYGTGVEAFTLAPRGVPSMMSDGPAVSDFNECRGNARDAENIALATATHAALVVRTRMFDRGLKRARFVVIRDITIPGVLIEGGFQTNPYDAKMIATAGYRQLLAQAILQAVDNYRRAVGTHQEVPTVSTTDEDTKPTKTKPGPTAKRETPKPSKPAPIEPAVQN
jgi:N-acetylmuramoyl-L-alanine amidase